MHVLQVLLLVTDDTAWPYHAQPGDCLPRCDFVPPHHVQGDQRASPPQPGLTVHRDEALGAVYNSEELCHDAVGRLGAVGEGQVVVLDAICLQRPGLRSWAC